MKMRPKALLFDMDGTLTDARQPITQDVLETLSDTRAGIKRYLVTGSDFSKVEDKWETTSLGIV